MYGLKYLAMTIAVIIFFSSIDDVFIDITYWIRRVWRSQTIYKKNERLQYTALNEVPEKPLAIMVPAWNETGVIGKMAELAATTMEYENYHVFVGTYPNDPDTQKDVDRACAIFPNVHKVICARPGPTSKADCLNNVLDAILQFERQTNLEFAGFILHDAEDVISSMELKLFNYLVNKNDLIQVPVYPFERKWNNFTSMHYLDEFTELHGKDIPIREAVAGQVPSAGVGTCFSRRAVLALLADGDGIAFDIKSLTEDYDIGIRLKEKGLKEIFVRFPVLKPEELEDETSKPFGQDITDANVICVREYFPDTIETAVRQKARWITGIVYQGYKTHGWTKNWLLNYFLWRDRKGAVTNFISFAATLILIQLTFLWLYQHLWPDAYHFLSIFSDDKWFVAVLMINLYLMINRMLQRIYFVSSYYGLREGLMSIPRLFWGNYINFVANWRALRAIIKQGDPHRVAWDKTMHDFPSLGQENHERQMLGQILIEQGAISEAELNTALLKKTRGLKIGNWLIHTGKINSEELAKALSTQSGVSSESVDAYAIPPNIIKLLPQALALHYAALPVRKEGSKLVLASESNIDPVSLAAIARKLKMPVKNVLARHGEITVGLRHWYANIKTEDPKQLLENAISAGKITRAQADKIWDYFVPRQFLFAEILMSLGRIDKASLNALLLQHENSAENLSQFLVGNNIISDETLKEALDLQKELQPNIKDLIEKEAAAR
ncbi:phage adsorption protein NrfB [Polynucleobacter asymbioticus]|nr:phage adsorption protein NrfB [Polynucleobacter asymbioticus]